MYITISPQKIGTPYSTSVADFVDYLEKENTDRLPEQKECFFNHHNDDISRKEVIDEIDHNTAKLKTTEARYYSLTINPSQRELRHLQNDPEKLKSYTRELIKDYARNFNREINGRPVQASDIKYYGKIEYSRSFKESDREVRQNAPYSNRIARLKNDLRKIHRGELPGSMKKVEKEISGLYQQAPHKLEGKMIEPGLLKPGPQTHIHVIVSRKDMGNAASLSPGSKYKASEVVFQGKTIKRGFDRDRFFSTAENRFDKQFGFKRNYAEQYASRKTLLKSPKQFYANLLKLPTSERKLAMQLIKTAGVALPKIPDAKVRFAIKQLQKAMEIAMKSSSIGY